MASALNRLCVTAARGTYRIRPQAPCRTISIIHRPFHTSRLCRDEEPSPSDASTPKPETSISTSDRAELRGSETTTQNGQLTTYPPSDSQDVEAFSSLSDFSPQDETDPEIQAIIDDPPPEHRAAVEEWRSAIASAEADAHRQLSSLKGPEPPKPRVRPGFMAMGEENEMDEGEDEVFQGDDISALGHGNLEQHREIREYARIAAWEMPLLSSKFSIPQLPPTPLQPIQSPERQIKDFLT